MSRHSNREEGVVAEAVPVSDGSVLVTEELLQGAKAAADAELAKRKQDVKKTHDQELKQMESRLQAEVKSVKALLEESERIDSAVRRTAEQAVKLSKDTKHQANIAQLEKQNDTEQTQFEERIRGWKHTEEFNHRHWCAVNPKAPRLLEDRETRLNLYKAAKIELAEKLEARKQDQEKAWAQEEQAWKTECNALNSKHSSNLMLGLLVGAMFGYVFDRGARM